MHNENDQAQQSDSQDPAEQPEHADASANPDAGDPDPQEDFLPPAQLDSVPPSIRDAVARAGWASLMDVQARSIPYILQKHDLMVQSRTGSGKTGAFILPLAARLDPSKNVTQALILVPTRELARQVVHEAEMLLGTDGIRTVAMYGGVGYREQMDGLKAGAHLVVGTPGRILDHLLKRSMTLDDLDVLIFDEADRMLSMGFYPDMMQLRGYLPKRPVSGYMFSATYPPHVLRLANLFLRSPEMLSLSHDAVHVADVDHVYYVVPPMKRDRCLVRLIERENPASAIIFCNRKSEVHYVAVVLQRFGYDADELSSDLSQNARDRVLSRVREGKLRFLVATDVAARGIDIPDLSHVIQYQPPEDPESYIHRAGRTGRAGAGGEAITLVDPMEKRGLLAIASKYKIEGMHEGELPSDEDVEAVVTQRVTALLEARLRTRDRLQVERMQRFVPLVRSLAEDEEAAALIAMMIDDYYQDSLHAPLAPPEHNTQKEDGSAAKDKPKRKRRPRRKD